MGLPSLPTTRDVTLSASFTGSLLVRSCASVDLSRVPPNGACLWTSSSSVNRMRLNNLRLDSLTQLLLLLPPPVDGMMLPLLSLLKKLLPQSMLTLLLLLDGTPLLLHLLNPPTLAGKSFRRS